MTANAKRLVLWGLIAAVAAAALLFAMRPRPALVDLHTVGLAPLEVTVDAEGMTQVKEVFTISAPVGGRVLRNPLVAGDTLVQGVTVVATLEPSDPALLDPRAVAESQQELQAAEAAHTLARAELDRAEAEQAFASADLGRARELFQAGSVPRRFVDEAERAARMADAAVAAAAAAVDARQHEVLRARARLLTPATAPRGDGECQCVNLTAPVDGRVLRIFEKSESVVSAGTPLLEIGDPGSLEIVADFLSADAVRIRAGQPAWLSGWGGERDLQARVRHVEPFAYTKVSALGIEEQRVNVLFDLVSPPAEWSALGHGYRVIARVVVHYDDQALTVPVTSLFRDDGRWHVFVDSEGRAEPRPVETGHWAGLKVQILDGLRPGEPVVVSPPGSLSAGARIAPRSVR
jgi:HlyD family secretion protein